MYECVEVFVLLQQSLTPPVRAVCVDWAEEAVASRRLREKL